MRFVQLGLVGFRNWSCCEVEFDQGINLFWGDNGQGKTNLLEALYFVAHLNSFRTSQNSEMMQWGVDRCLVEATAESMGVPRRLRVELGNEQRSLLVDGSKVRAVEDFFSGVRVVLFAPQHVELVRGPPSLRRRYMDRMAFRRGVDHLGRVRDYLKVLRSRNVILRERRGDLWDVYTRKLAHLGAGLTVARLSVLEEVNQRLGEVYSGLVGTEERVEIRYRSTWRRGGEMGKKDLEECYLGQLTQNRSLDAGRGFTTVGPHTDDMEILIDDRPARRYASEGQVRSVALALGVGEYSMLSGVYGEPPVFLMDDLSSELDRSRRQSLFKYLTQMDGQLFVTATSGSELPLDVSRKEFEVVGGAVRRGR